MGVTNDPIFESLVQSYGAQGGFKIEAGRATFTTTATSESLKTHMSRVIAVIALPAATTTDVIFWDQAGSTSGTYAVPSAGTITIKRSAGGTSGLAFSYLIIGL